MRSPKRRGGHSSSPPGRSWPPPESCLRRVNPSGTKVLFWQRVGAGGTTALSIMPFDSGPAVQVGAPVQDFENYNWAAGGEGVLMARRRGDRFVVTETDPSTSVVKEMGTVPAPAGAARVPHTDFGRRHAGRGPVERECDLFRPIGVPDAPDTTFHVPGNWCYTTPVPAPNRAEAILPIVGSSTVPLMSISLASRPHCATHSAPCTLLDTGEVAAQWSHPAHA